MSVSRRNLILGAGGLFALAGVAGTYRVTRMPVTATLPWRIDPTPPQDVRLDAFRHAILAPNPHNRQPWEIRLVGNDEAIITCDLERRLPQTDPFDRQILIGFGGFFELARMAAAERGVRMTIEPFPEGEPGERLDKRPIARLKFIAEAGLAKDPLFASVLTRRTAKIPYDMSRPVLASDFASLAALSDRVVRVTGSETPGDVPALRDLIWRAWDIEAFTTRTWKESMDLLRVGAAEIDANPDCIAVKGPMFEALSLMGTDSIRTQAVSPASTAFKSTRERYRVMFAATPAFLWLTTESNSRREHLESGKAWLRANLMATKLGLSVQPISQAVQEYPEMKAEFDNVHRLVGAKPGQRVQMLARLGYSATVEPTPRWPLEAKLTKS
ncbi:MAG: Acg family FMN-binding oxidoreductase [Bosea sp. (in: a-proteobacteria)]